MELIDKFYAGIKKISKPLMTAGLVASLSLGIAGCSEYRGGGDYSCKRLANDMTIVRDGDKKMVYYPKDDGTVFIDYARGFEVDEIPVAIKSCERAFND